MAEHRVQIDGAQLDDDGEKLGWVGRSLMRHSHDLSALMSSVDPSNGGQDEAGVAVDQSYYDNAVALLEALSNAGQLLADFGDAMCKAADDHESSEAARASATDG